MKFCMASINVKGKKEKSIINDKLRSKRPRVILDRRGHGYTFNDTMEWGFWPSRGVSASHTHQALCFFYFFIFS